MVLKSPNDFPLYAEDINVLAIDAAAEVVWKFDIASQRFCFSNKWKTEFGYSNDEVEILAERFFSLAHSEDMSNLKQCIELILNEKSTALDIEYRIRKKNGDYCWIHFRGCGFRDYSGKLKFICGLLGDINERKKKESERERDIENLKFALASEKVLLEELDKKNKELVELSITDGLTGLYNHRFLQERFEYELRRAKRYGTSLSCLIIDIDHFKNINDTYGHQCGDLVLRQLGQMLRTNSRDVDICGRYGGEEFMIITNLNSEDALKYASKLHNLIRNRIFEVAGKSLRLTVSIGIAEYRGDAKDKQIIIERADMALYQAKQQGRDLIRIWKEENMPQEQVLDHNGISLLKQQFSKLSDQTRSIYIQSTNALILAVDAKDNYTKEHSQRVAEYAVEIALTMELTSTEIEVIKYAALLHDIGKIGINQEILVKDAPLTTEEYEILKRHPAIGVSILKDVKFLEKEIPLILHHHERYDGLGYPHGLKGPEIPIGARILAVADSFVAMTSDRRYREKCNVETAMKKIMGEKCKQFAPEVVDAFVKMMQKKGYKL